jgi:hypothetical protein
MADIDSLARDLSESIAEPLALAPAGKPMSRLERATQVSETR